MAMAYRGLVAIGCLAVVMLAAAASGDEIPIPRSSPGDKGKYYLVDMNKNDHIWTTVVKRVGVYNTVFTRSEVNCQTFQYRILGEGDTFNGINSVESKWTDLVAGSSKYDLVRFVCSIK